MTKPRKLRRMSHASILKLVRKVGLEIYEIRPDGIIRVMPKELITYPEIDSSRSSNPWDDVK